MYTWDGSVWMVGAAPVTAGIPAGGDLQGTYPNPTIKPSALLWQYSGTAITPADSSKDLSIPHGLGLFGQTVNTTRIQAPGKFTVNQGATTQDDVTHASWVLSMDPVGDVFMLQHAKAAAQPPAAVLQIDTNGAVLTDLNQKLYARIQSGNLATFDGPTGHGSRIQQFNDASMQFGTNTNWLTGVRDDSTQPTWYLYFGNKTTDKFTISRAPAGTNFSVDFLTVSSTGTTSLTNPLTTTSTINLTGSTSAIVAGAPPNSTGHLMPGNGWLALALNRNPNTGVQDDSSKTSWQLTMNVNDSYVISRQAGGGALYPYLTIDSVAGITSTGHLFTMAAGSAKARWWGTTTATSLSVNRDPVSGNLDDNTKASMGLWLDAGNNLASITYGTSPSAYTIWSQSRTSMSLAGGQVNYGEGSVVQLQQAYSNVYGDGTGNPVWDFVLNWPTTGNTTMEGIPTWMMRLAAGGQDSFSVYRALIPGQGVNWLWRMILTNIGNFQIAGDHAYKNSGTTWEINSDPSLKTDIGTYTRGLADIVVLEPITYRLRESPDTLCYGFDASAVQEIMPECVGQADGHLTFDMHPVLVAMVNAIKELARKL